MPAQFHNYQALHWEGVNYNRETLRKFAYDQIRKKIPAGKQDFFQFILEWTNDQEYIILQTSGTTGEKKSVQVHKDHLLKSALLSEKSLGLTGIKNAGLALSPIFIAGKMMIVRAMVLGWNLILLDPNSNPLISTDAKINFIALVPAQVFEILQDSLSELKLRSIKKVLIGGGVLSQPLENALNKFPNEIYHSFGMTETLSHFALRRVNGKNPESEYSVIEGFAINIGSDGCLIIEKTPWSDEAIHTKDLIELTAPDKFIWRGRKDNLINSGGVKIIPEEVEKKLAPFIEHPFFIGAESNSKWGEVIVLKIEGAESEVDWKSVWLSANLQIAETPKKVEFLSEIRRTDSKKIIRS